MPSDWEGVDRPCPSCGLIGVWMCSSPECPMKDGQKAARDRWQERQNGSDDESRVQ